MIDRTKTTRTVDLTLRELTLIRVALLTRLARLHGREDCADAYNESRALLMGKLCIEALHCKREG